MDISEEQWLSFWFNDIEIDIIQMYRKDGMKETEIAESLGIPVSQVNETLAKYEVTRYG